MPAPQDVQRVLALLAQRSAFILRTVLRAAALREAIGRLPAPSVADSSGMPLRGVGPARLRTWLSSTLAPSERTQLKRLRARISVGPPASGALRST